MLAQDGGNGVRGTEKKFEGQASGVGRQAYVYGSGAAGHSTLNVVGNGVPALQEQPTAAGEDACATRGVVDADDATPGENFYKRLEALLTNNGPACYIIGEFGGEFFVRLQRSPDPTLAGHGRTITEALSSLLDCAQAEQTVIGLAKAGEF